MTNLTKDNLTAALSEVITNSFVSYNGCTIELQNFKALGKTHTSFAEARATIDQAYSSLQKSIR
jgi:hypothetical protein